APSSAASAAAGKPAASLAAAASQSAASPKPAGSQAPSGQVAKLKMPYTSPSAVYAPNWAGAEQGIFLKHGLDVTVSYLETNAVSAALTAGEIDVSPTPSTLNLILSGGDAVLIASLVSAPVFSLYATPAVDNVKALNDKV